MFPLGLSMFVYSRTWSLCICLLFTSCYSNYDCWLQNCPGLRKS